MNIVGRKQIFSDRSVLGGEIVPQVQYEDIEIFIKLKRVQVRVRLLDVFVKNGCQECERARSWQQ